MASRFGGDTADYGTLSGHSRGFSSDGEFLSLKERAGNLVMEIKQSTQKLHQQENRIGTPSDTEDFRGNLQNILRKTLNKIQTVKSLIVQLVNISKESNDRGQGLAVQSLRQSITSAVDEFQEASQRVLRAMEDAGDPFRSKTPLSASITLSDTAEVNDDGDRARLIRGGRSEQPQGQQQEQQQVVVSDDTAYMEQRAERMEQLDNEIGALNDIMRDITNLVADQGEQIDHIERNVEDACTDVVQGNQQLEKGVRLKRCSRKLMCVIGTIVGAIVLVILIIIIVVIVKVVPQKKE